MHYSSSTLPLHSLPITSHNSLHLNLLPHSLPSYSTNSIKSLAYYRTPSPLSPPLINLIENQSIDTTQYNLLPSTSFTAHSQYIPSLTLDLPILTITRKVNSETNRRRI